MAAEPKQLQSALASAAKAAELQLEILQSWMIYTWNVSHVEETLAEICGTMAHHGTSSFLRGTPGGSCHFLLKSQMEMQPYPAADLRPWRQLLEELLMFCTFCIYNINISVHLIMCIYFYKYMNIYIYIYIFIHCVLE